MWLRGSALMAGWGKAIQPIRLRSGLRLRLHSGLRQQGKLLRSWLFLARLKPCPFEGLARRAGVFGGGGDGRDRSRGCATTHS